MIALQPLPAERLSSLRALLGDMQAQPELGYPLEAAIAGTAPLTAWADDPAHPTLAYLWDERVLHYVLGARMPAASAAVARLYEVSILPALRVRSDRYLQLRYADPAWGEGLSGSLNVGCYPRVAYLRPPAAPTASMTLPSAYTLVEINAALLADDSLALDSVREEIASVWPRPEDFIAHAWGYGILAGRELVTWCTAEEVSPGRCGVGIWTHEAHRGQSLATAAAIAFAQRCAREGRTALWDAWAGNAASRRVAEKAGWRLCSTYTVLAGEAPAGETPVGGAQA